MASRIPVFPPYKHLSTLKTVPSSDALSRIQAYLDESQTAAYLHPDCTFTESGPQASNISAGGLVLHQLRRVEQGLRGIVLKPEIEVLDREKGAELEQELLDKLTNDAEQSDTGDGPRESNDRRLDALIRSYESRGNEEEGQLEDPDAEPIENYQEQLRDLGFGVVEGDIGQRTPETSQGRAGIPSSTNADNINGKKRRREDLSDVGRTPEKDKEARKRAKKERNKMEKRQKEMSKQSDRKMLESNREDLVVEHEPLLDETRDEEDEPGPSSSYIPNKTSSNTVEPLSTLNGIHSSSEKISKQKSKTKGSSQVGELNGHHKTLTPRRKLKDQIQGDQATLGAQELKQQKQGTKDKRVEGEDHGRGKIENQLSNGHTEEEHVGQYITNGHDAIEKTKTKEKASDDRAERKRRKKEDRDKKKRLKDEKVKS